MISPANVHSLHETADLRIFHIDDHWESWRTIPHRLFDQLFTHLPQEKQVDIELEEREGEAVDTFESYAFSQKAKRCYLYYFFGSSLPIRRTRFLATDVFVLDIMRDSAANSVQLPSIDEEIMKLNSLGVSVENCRYFSTSIDGMMRLPCKGFSKSNYQELVQFLFGRLKLKMDEARLGSLL